ncbi:MAG: lysophospholipid acyltransferase family protein [Desulfobacteraceae bacterium]
MKSSKRNHFRWYDAILLRVVPPLVALVIKLLMLSCRVVRMEGEQRRQKALSKSRGGAIYVTWHQRMSYFFHYGGSHHVTTMISRSRDGEYAARLASWLGFRNVRGSSTRGGMRAVRELVRKIKEGEIGGMLADGPQGPAREAKMGSVMIAREAEVPLIPVLWGADRCWMFNSWDRYLVPKPFAKIAMFIGEAIWIPDSAKGNELQQYRQLLEKRLNEGTRWCDEQFGPERPWRKVPEQGMPEIGPL